MTILQKGYIIALIIATYSVTAEEKTVVYYWMGQKVIKEPYKPEPKKVITYARRLPERTVRYENGKLVRYYFGGNFRNGYDGSRSPGKRKCR